MRSAELSTGQSQGRHLRMPHCASTEMKCHQQRVRRAVRLGKAFWKQLMAALRSGTRNVRSPLHSCARCWTKRSRSLGVKLNMCRRRASQTARLPHDGLLLLLRSQLRSAAPMVALNSCGGNPLVGPRTLRAKPIRAKKRQ